MGFSNKNMNKYEQYYKPILVEMVENCYCVTFFGSFQVCPVREFHPYLLLFYTPIFNIILFRARSQAKDIAIHPQL